MSENGSNKSGWERAESVASGVDKAIDGTALVLMKLWGLLLVIVGIVVLVIGFEKAWWVGLLAIAYGVYLLFPGSKFVIW